MGISKEQKGRLKKVKATLLKEVNLTILDHLTSVNVRNNSDAVGDQELLNI